MINTDSNGSRFDLRQHSSNNRIKIINRSNRFNRSTRLKETRCSASGKPVHPPQEQNRRSWSTVTIHRGVRSVRSCRGVAPRNHGGCGVSAYVTGFTRPWTTAVVKRELRCRGSFLFQSHLRNARLPRSCGFATKDLEMMDNGQEKGQPLFTGFRSVSLRSNKE